MLGENPPSKPVLDTAKKIGEAASEFSKAMDGEVTDPVNYVPGGVLSAVAKKFPNLNILYHL